MFNELPGIPGLAELLERSWAAAGPAVAGSWPPSQRMDRAALLQFCREQRLCVLAVATPAARPLVVPVSFHMDEEGCFWLPTDPGAARLRTLRRNPQAALLVGQGLDQERRVVTAQGRTQLHRPMEVPISVQDAAEAKLGDLRWAGAWVALRPERLLAYDPGSAGSLRTSPG